MHFNQEIRLTCLQGHAIHLTWINIFLNGFGSPQLLAQFCWGWGKTLDFVCLCPCHPQVGGEMLENKKDERIRDVKKQ